MIQLLRFSVVGALGFFVDALVLYSVLTIFPVGPLLARIPSFLCAATFTWIMNRIWTFSSSRRPGAVGQWFTYTLAVLVGAVVNYACYASVVMMYSASSVSPLLGLAVGSLAGLAVNFTLARTVVFRPG